MDKKIGFIGCGNMGTAMMAGMISSGLVAKEQILVCDALPAAVEKICGNLGVTAALNNYEVADQADILFLAVKPFYYEEVIAEIRDAFTEEKIFVSITPGKTLEWLQQQLGGPCKVIRCMPNTPAMVGEGMMGVCCSDKITDAELETFRELCSGFTRTQVVAENLMDVVTAVSGSSPAYVFLFIEAMADAAVAGGMPRAQAYEFAAQAVLGSAKMVLETGMHPGALKDMVCSPRGTTIQAVRVLEEKGMRSAVFEAVMKCIDMSRVM